MEGLGQGYEAFVESLHSSFAAVNGKDDGSQKCNNMVNNSSGRNGFPPHPSQSQRHHSKQVGYPSSMNPFNSKGEPSPSLSDSSVHSSSVSMDVPMQEGATSASLPSPGRPNFVTDVNLIPDIPPPHRGHRRAQSEISFRLCDDVSLEHEPGLLETPTFSDEQGDDLFSMCLDMNKLNSHSATSSSSSAGLRFPPDLPALQPHHMRSLSVDGAPVGSIGKQVPDGPAGEVHQRRPRHQHSLSMDGSMPISRQELISLESLDAKKAMAADKLAELAMMDPKRAKRVLANRQSAARSKERKIRYIAELERKVQTLQTEATTLSAQLTMLQRDTSGLSVENNELKLRLQSMEQQAHLREALNDALKDEVQRLKVVTGQLNTGNGHMLPLPMNPQFFQQMQRMAQQQQARLSPQQHLHQVQENFVLPGTGALLGRSLGALSGMAGTKPGEGLQLAGTGSSP